MDKHIIVIASGETERLALPHLSLHLQEMGVSVRDVRIPPRNLTLDIQMAERLIKAAWYENAVEPPNKFVVLVDINGAVPDEVLDPFKKELPRRLGENIGAIIQFAYARQHLESWYFADATNLRSYLGQALGSVDTSNPDQIENPKLHLQNLLGERIYTARTSEAIARTLDGRTIAERSPSFRGFVDALKNGNFVADTNSG